MNKYLLHDFVYKCAFNMHFILFYFMIDIIVKYWNNYSFFFIVEVSIITFMYIHSK